MEKPQAKPAESRPAAEPTEQAARSFFTPVNPTPAQEPPQPKAESRVLQTLLEDLDTEPQKTAEPPKTPPRHDVQEEIILLDIDND